MFNSTILGFKIFITFYLPSCNFITMHMLNIIRYYKYIIYSIILILLLHKFLKKMPKIVKYFHKIE